MQSTLLVVFNLFFSAGVLFFDVILAHGFIKQFESGHYQVVAGRVTHSEVKSYRGSKGKTYYEAAINYRFESDGRVFTSARLRYLGPSFWGSNSPQSLVAAHPTGATVQVFCNPANLEDSVLLPGLDGSDFMLALFSFPFNALMVSFLIWMGGWLRERLFRPVAGGVKIIADTKAIRVRLPRSTAAAWGLATTAGLGFVCTFTVGYRTQMQPSVGLILTVIVAVCLAGTGVYFWKWWQIRSGLDDLVINHGVGTLDLPRTFGRKERMAVSKTDIESIMVEKIAHGRGGTIYTYAPTLRLRGAAAGEQKLADWQDKVKAEDFAQWLYQQLGL